MDAPLMFEVLLYLNIYYFGVFAGSELLIFFAKFNSPLPTPNINIDGGVVGGILFAELLKLLSFQKVRQKKKGAADFLAILFTSVSITGLLYIFILQSPVLKIELIVCGIMFLLLTTEFMFGFLQFLPCCKKKEYSN
ncbi:PREDICTED: uncharacterized protein LOC108568033 [Nicrophorus vespilloides]|uniref:Uncharacterized protein LOC108568033 n=1 Tax=Nicrophorus vespilloides TaxID=110193 RepID=A0ABM1NC20_NICVS|nr:PREDICTED: uncharacterized protein LOC108568033 [Nicrophorus vespilloides]